MKSLRSCIPALALAFAFPLTAPGQEAPSPAAPTTGPITPAPSAESATPAPVPVPAVPQGLPNVSDAPEKPEPPHASWFTDYQAARKKAIEEEKHLLLLFTGSDWIPLCRIFDRDVLNQQSFIDAVSEFVVPVRFDFPKDEKLPAAIAAQNHLFMRAYRVSAFPTVYLTDTDGRPYGVNGYQPVTPVEYGKIISTMRQMAKLRDQYFAKADASEGVEKAQLLVKGVPNLPGNLSARYYRPQMEAIIASDPEDQTGKVDKCRRLLADVDYTDQMQKLEHKVEWSRMLDLTDSFIKENNLQGAERQQALLNKVRVLEKQGNTTDVVRTLLEIVSIDEMSPPGQKAKSALDRLRARKLEEELSPR